jgi:glycosyltransferase involved in cell wall biosynthesis
LPHYTDEPADRETAPVTARPLIYLAPNRWHGPRQRPQHLAAGLARTRPVVFVEPAAYSLPGAVRRRLAGERGGLLRAGLERLDGSVTVYSPPPTIPGNLHLRGLNALVHALAWRGLRRALPSIAAGPVDVLVGWPPAVELARRLRPRRLVYDCLDLFPSFEHGLRRRLLASTEAELARIAFAVVVPSRDLERRWSRRHPRVVRIANGVELGVFGQDAAVAPEIDRLPRPRLGYVGTVGRWVDLPLLRHVAERRPECGIALVGPLEPGTAAPAGPANLVAFGERPYASLPAYLAGMDVLLIPFRLMDLTHAVNPIKLYEYCATGKPIVATPIEEVVAEGHLCHLGAGPEAFLAAVDAALREALQPDAERSAARRALAVASGWERRVAALAALLDDAVADGP